MRTIAVLMTMLIAGAAQIARADLADTLVREAHGAVGIRYAYGKSGRTATDCAALTKRVAESVGVKLPRTTREQYRVGEPVRRDELAPGDLVFFRNTYRKGISHVGIYVGEGKFIHAASRQRYVVVDHLDEPYYRTRFAGGRRIVERDRGPNPAEVCAVP